MNVFLTWLRCAWAGHPRNITVLERFVEPLGPLWATEEHCKCGKSRAQMYPGAMHKVVHEAYKECPRHWPDIFDGSVK